MALPPGCQLFLPARDLTAATLHKSTWTPTSKGSMPRSKFECNYCPYSSNNRGHIVEHGRTHTGERPHVCEICRKGFVWPECLDKHVRIHTKERRLHECRECGQRFGDPSNQH